MSQRSFLHREGMLLSLVDYGGSGSPILLLHGLAGHGEEWAETAGWLRDGYRVFALDMRGHGYSERRPADVSVHALVEDAVAVIDLIGPPVVLVGQSLGGVIALLVAARRPDLVSALIMIEASPAGMDESAAAELAHTVAEQLRSWPVPFFLSRGGGYIFRGSLVERDRVGQRTRRARRRTMAPLRRRRDGTHDLRSRKGVTLGLVGTDRCPVLVVAGDPLLRSGDLERMSTAQPTDVFAKLPGAQHDVHLDQPEGWRTALSRFLKALT